MKRFALYTAKGDKTGKGGIERDMENEIQQLKRSVNEQVLQRAEADPQWRQQILDDPEAAMSDIPEARQLREILESTTTTMPTTTAGEEHSQLQRSLMEKILDKAASNPTWKQQLLEDPEAAMQEANFPEAQQLLELRQEQAEVMAHQRWVQHRDSLDSAPAVQLEHRCVGGGSYSGYWSLYYV